MNSPNPKGPPEIVYDDIGAGPCVVFLHGFLESKEIWEHFSQRLSSQYRIIAVDLPGHGQSDCIEEVHTMELMAEEVRNILEINGINKCVMIGHSMGGYVTMAFAELFPQFLKGLVLFHSHAGADSDEQKKNREIALKAIKNNHIQFVSQFMPTLFAPENINRYAEQIKNLEQTARNTSVEGIIAAMEGMKQRPDRVHILNQLSVPALIIAGDKDSRIPVDMIKKQIGENSSVQLEILKNTGHMGFIEAEKESFKLIKKFLSTVY